MATSCASSTTTKSKTGLVVFDIAAASELNTSAYVTSLRAFNPARTRSKMVHKSLRFGSGMRVFLPSRATSRYTSHPSSCQATAGFLSRFGFESLSDVPDIEKLGDAGLIGRAGEGALGGDALAAELRAVLGLAGDEDEREQDAA
jgi:hypothetical protein